MIRLVGTVTYTDGDTRAVEVAQAEFGAWELHALRLGLPANPEGAPPITMLRYLGFAAIHRGEPARDWPDYDEWNSRVLDVELADPTGELDANGDGVTATFPAARSVG